MAVPSINVPKIRRMIATTKQNKVEFRFIATTVSTSAWEAPEKVICIILVRQLFLSDVLVRLFHALDPLRTTRCRAQLPADAGESFVGGPRKTNATCGGACFAMHIENAPVTHSKISLDYTIYPPLIGDTACSENSLRVPLVYFGGFGCHLAFLAFKISSISSVVRFSPFTPTISSLRSFTLI